MKLFKNNQQRKSILPKIKHFLTKMVQKRGCFLTTCINAIHEDKNIKQMRRYSQETGRSMVEMLGVLAIIGVLSVGGIAGYSKAMYKQKMNKSVDIVSKVLMGVNEWSAKNIDDNFDNQNAIKLGILDKSLCNNSNECILPTGGRINVYDDGIEIQFRESNRINLCIDFLSHHWENSSGIFDVITATTYNGEHHYIYSTNTNLGIKTSYTLADIEEACNTACDNEWVCYVYFYNWNKSDYAS